MLHVDTASQRRGGQVQVGLLVAGMIARGHRALVATPPGGALARSLGEAALSLPPLGPRAVLALRRHIAAVCPDVVAAHTPHAHGLCLLAGCRPVVHRRVDFAVGRDPLSRAKYRRAALYVAVSQAVAAVLIRGGVPAERIRVVYDGVDTPPRAVPAPDLAGPGPLIGAAGALVAHKGHRILLEALARLPAQRCVIAGEGPLRGALTAQAAALGLLDRLRLLGQRDDLPAVLAALDLLVHPSLEEGLGQVVLEAMAAGVPVVVSAAGGLPEVVGDTSVPVPVGDPGALARAIAARLADPGDLAAARARARDLFSVDAMVEGTLAAYEEAASHLEPTP